jgi:indole-3-glycerol phosphate synthase
VILDQIIARKREAKAARPAFDIRPMAPRGPKRSLASALRPGLKVIAEFKRKSPSAGAIRPGADPAKIASDYEKAGAAAISVLTDVEFFDGDAAHLERARQAVAVPVLRKDFLLDERDLFDSYGMGADAVLLIARILDDAVLPAMLKAVRSLGMEALVETHNDQEIDRALAAGAEIIGVNHRDLDTLQIDLSLSARARERIGERILVAESGIRTPADVQRMRDHGADAILVGEHLMRQPDPGRALVELCSSAS